MSELPTWNDIANHAITALKEAQLGLSTARDWMNSDWSEGHGPAEHDQRHEAARLIGEAKARIDQAKNALYQGTGSDRR